MTLSFSPANGLRARLVVLSDRRPAPGALRTELESAIEWAVREHDGIWIVRYANMGEDSGPIDGDSRDPDRDRWSVLDDPPPRGSDDAWAEYLHANSTYAERIVEVVSPGGVVWVNGHHWLLVAHELRKHGHGGPIGLLLDVPFPAPPRLEALPWYGPVMASLGQLDLIGFRTPECAARFEACRMRAGRHRPWIGVFPDGTRPGTRAATHGDPEEQATGFLTMLGSAASREPRRRFVE